MSIVFYVDETVQWNPSNRVGRLFKGQLDAAATAFELDSGASDIIADEVRIDLKAYETFVGELMRIHHGAGHLVMKQLLLGFIPTASVLVERAGGELPRLDPTEDAAWAQLRAIQSSAMPR